MNQCKKLKTQYDGFLKGNKMVQIELDMLVKTLKKSMVNLEELGTEYDEVTKKIAGIKSGNANRLKELQESSAKNKADLEVKLKASEEKARLAIEHEKAELEKKDQAQKLAQENLKKEQEAEAKLAKDAAEKAKQEALTKAKAESDVAAKKAAEEAATAAGLAGEAKVALEARITALNEEHKLALEKAAVKQTKALAMQEMTSQKHEKELLDQANKDKEALKKEMTDALKKLGEEDAAKKAAELKAAQAKCDAQQQQLFGEINAVLAQVGTLTVQAEENHKVKLLGLQEIITKSTESINTLAEKIKRDNAAVPNAEAAASGKKKLGSAMGKLAIMNKGAKAASLGAPAKQTKMDAVGIMKKASTVVECDTILDEYRIQKRQCKTNVNLKNKTKAAAPAPAAPAPTPATGGDCASLPEGREKKRCIRRKKRAARKAEAPEESVADFNERVKREAKETKGGFVYGKKSRRRKRTLKTKIKTQRLRTLKIGKKKRNKKSRRRKRSKSSKKRRK